jgi:5-methyltetrahydropteroyltriglutamate--homocysteine methyltransferase
VPAAALDRRLTEAVGETVQRQIECGIDIVNNGELSKFNFTDYVRDRIAGYELRPSNGRRRLDIIARDEKKFAGYFETHPRAGVPGPPTQSVCTAPLRYVGHAELRKDLDSFQSSK